MFVKGSSKWGCVSVELIFVLPKFGTQTAKCVAECGSKISLNVNLVKCCLSGDTFVSFSKLWQAHSLREMHCPARCTDSQRPIVRRGVLAQATVRAFVALVKKLGRHLRHWVENCRSVCSDWQCRLWEGNVLQFYLHIFNNVAFCLFYKCYNNFTLGRFSEYDTFIKFCPSKVYLQVFKIYYTYR